MADMKFEDKQRGVHNFSMAHSVAPAKIQFERIDTSTLPEHQRQFVANVLKHRQVIYDWGQAAFYSCPDRFVVDRASKSLTPTAESGTYTGVWQDDLHPMAGDAWEGDYSPIAADAVLAMLNSGVEVELVNTEKWGPGDPVEFMRSLRSMLAPPPR